MNDHLTSAQLEPLLFAGVSEASEAADPHLRGCELCRAELASLRSTFGSLRSGATLAAERHQRLAAAPQRNAQRSARPMRLIGSLAAAAIVLAVSLPVALRHPSPAHPNVAQTPQTAPPNETATISTNLSDEQLLTTVQGDLAASVPDSMLPLDASTSTATATK
jgi:anti-sigma factor RsiW